MKTAIITGITGQDGAYLAQLLLEQKYKVVGTTRNLESANLRGLDYLGIKERIILEQSGLSDLDSVRNLIKKNNPCEIYNLAAQSSVSLSFKKIIQTVEPNIMSVLYILESIKSLDKKIKFFQPSSSEMFGKVSVLPVNENTAFHPLSPYAISKAAAHWLTINFRESFGLHTITGIMFNHDSFLRDRNFFIKKIVIESIEVASGKRECVRVGNIDVKRDFGFSPDYVKAMWLSMQQKDPDDYIICSGKSILLRDIVEYVFNKFKIPMDKLVEDKNLFRPTDIVDMYGSNEESKKRLGWKYEKSFYEVLDIMIEEEIKFQNNEKNS